MLRATDVANFVAGFVVAEGCFTRSGRSFTFAIGLGAVDRGGCEATQDFFGVGTTHWYPRRKSHYDDEVVYQVRRTQDLVEVIVPFMDAHLPPSHKRRQFETWRAALLDHWENTARRRRACSVDACDEPQRARGLCRGHYYKEFRR